MHTTKDQIALRSSGFDALKWLKYVVLALLVLVAVAVSIILITGDSWAKMKARTAAKGQIDYYTERQGPDGPSTMASRHKLVWLLINQKFPVAARRENNRYLSDLKRIPDYDPPKIQNEKGLTAHEFRRAGFLNIALEEFSAIEAEDGDSYSGLIMSRSIITTLMEMKRYTEAEAKCREILNSPEKLKHLRQFNEWDPWALLAKCLADQGKHAEAEPAFNNAIAASVESRGTDHFHTHFQRVQLAHSLAVMGRNEEALALARRALPVFENYEYSGYENVLKLREFIASMERSTKSASF
ncbi:MAG: tetratricopeptide repeat protein [Luteolibacter sp.]